jgi:hypothetical protein
MATLRVVERSPTLAHSPSLWDCACADFNTRRIVIWNPFRDRSPESVADNFLDGLRANTCSIGCAVCENALPNHRVTDWRLAYREDEDKGRSVSLYYKLRKYGESRKSGPLSGVGAIDLRRDSHGRWTVTGYDSYF